MNTDVISEVLGWLYFLAWSISFYPQVILNAQRKSIDGLSIDFVMLNWFGFTCYAVFNGFHYFVFKSPDVQIQDLSFSVHAWILCAVTVAQSLWYSPEPRFTSILNKTSTSTRLILPTCTVAIFAAAFALPGLSWLTLLGSVKVGISLIKYVPQLLLNWRNKSTIGWSITNILLDASGGVLSVGQLFVDSSRLGRSVLDNPVKLALGLQSLSFDFLFILQHYVWFTDSGGAASGIANEGSHLLENTV
ncbi:PQ loop repeat-domain-containing protein [Obelidium mucronatum]|nr:PQ loop repeat-domain-containing protein [Obelidium mucronatum]